MTTREILNKKNVSELKEMMKKNNLKLSKNGKALNKPELINELMNVSPVNDKIKDLINIINTTKFKSFDELDKNKIFDIIDNIKHKLKKGNKPMDIYKFKVITKKYINPDTLIKSRNFYIKSIETEDGYIFYFHNQNDLDRFKYIIRELQPKKDYEIIDEKANEQSKLNAYITKLRYKLDGLKSDYMQETFTLNNKLSSKKIKMANSTREQYNKVKKELESFTKMKYEDLPSIDIMKKQEKKDLKEMKEQDRNIKSNEGNDIEFSNVKLKKQKKPNLELYQENIENLERKFKSYDRDCLAISIFKYLYNNRDLKMKYEPRSLINESLFELYKIIYNYDINIESLNKYYIDEINKRKKHYLLELYQNNDNQYSDNYKKYQYYDQKLQDAGFYKYDDSKNFYVKQLTRNINHEYDTNFEPYDFLLDDNENTNKYIELLNTNSSKILTEKQITTAINTLLQMRKNKGNISDDDIKKWGDKYGLTYKSNRIGSRNSDYVNKQRKEYLNSIKKLFFSNIS